MSVSHMMVGLDLNFSTLGWRAGEKSELVPEGGQQDIRATTCRKKVIATSYDIGFQRSRSQIKATSVSYMMVGVDLNFGAQGWRAAAKTELVPEGGQQDSRSIRCSKKVITPSYDIIFKCSRSQLKATRVSYMVVGVDINF
jgi:hypothetical protein